MKSPLVLVLCLLLAAPGCASSRLSYARLGSPASQRTVPMDARLMAEYVRQLPVGARIRVSLTNGSVLRGTLMKRDADPIVVQRRTRIPEPPVEIAVANIAALELETSNGSVGRNVGIAAGAAVAATLGVLLMLAAIYSD